MAGIAIFLFLRHVTATAASAKQKRSSLFGESFAPTLGEEKKKKADATSLQLQFKYCLQH